MQFKMNFICCKNNFHILKNSQRLKLNFSLHINTTLILRNMIKKINVYLLGVIESWSYKKDNNIKDKIYNFIILFKNFSYLIISI